MVTALSARDTGQRAADGLSNAVEKKLFEIMELEKRCFLHPVFVK